MNPSYEKQLEAEIDRRLRTLPLHRAPESLAPRIMAAIQFRRRVPWYRQPWPMWPMGMRISSLGGLAALFASLCFVFWQASETLSLIGGFRTLGSWLARENLLPTGLLATGEVLLRAVGHIVPLDAGILLASLLVAYVLCVGLGTLCWRLLRGCRY
jgi:hypothetical protein